MRPCPYTVEVADRSYVIFASRSALLLYLQFPQLLLIVTLILRGLDLLALLTIWLCQVAIVFQTTETTC
jgi:hypothetical protein